MEQIANKPITPSQIVWFCNECLISTVSTPEEICVICHARRLNRIQVDRDQTKRDLLVVGGIVAIIFALAFLLAKAI